MTRAYVTAGQRSRCGWCDEEIQVGEPITLLDDEWIHAHCEDEADELEFRAQQPKEAA